MRRRALIVLAIAPLGIPAVALALATLKASTSNVTFTTRCAHTAADSESIRITNDGSPEARDVRVAVSPESRAQIFPLSGTTAVPTLEPEDSFRFSVGFVPEARGTVTGNAVVSYQAVAPSSKKTPSPTPTSKTTSIALKGSAIDRFIAVSPPAVNFGTVRVGREGPDKRVTIFDDGDSRLTISSVSLAGRHAGDFSLGKPDSTTVRDGDPAHVTIGFEAGEVGARTADLVIRSNSCEDATLRVPLAGIGVEPDAVILPTGIRFAKEKVGERSKRIPITLVNQGGAPLRVREIRLSGEAKDEFTLSNLPDLPRTFAPGRSVEFFLRVRPAEVGRRRATLVVESNDPDSKVLRRRLSAEGVRIEPTPSPTPTPTPVASPPPGGGGFSFPIGDYLGEIGIVTAIGLFFGLLALVRRVRGAPE